MLPPTEFRGTLPCPGDDYQEGTVETVFLGRSEEGSVIRRQVRGSIQQQTVDGMGDPRLDGTWSAHMNSDGYYVGTTDEARPGLASIVVRIENDEGAWQGLARRSRCPVSHSPNGRSSH